MSSKPRLYSEEDLQRTVIEGLDRLRYIVRQTTVRVKRHRCPNCDHEFRPSVRTLVSKRGGFIGTHPGVSDLMVTRDTWPPNVWLGIELKGPDTAVSDEQKALAARLRIVICRSWDEVLAAIARYERLLQHESPAAKLLINSGKERLLQ